MFEHTMLLIITAYETVLRMECLLCTLENATSKVEFKPHILQEPVQSSDFFPLPNSLQYLPQLCAHNHLLAEWYHTISRAHHLLKQLQIFGITDCFMHHSSI